MIELSQWRACIGLWNCCCSGTKLKLCQDGKKIKQSRCISDVHVDNGFELLKLTFFAHFLTVTLSSILITIGLKIFFCSLLLLLSGDVELNPGPVIDERPNIFVLLDLLEPLENWQLFGRQLPGVTQQIIDMIQKSKDLMSSRPKKKALIEKWFKENPKATWKDVLAALKRRKEIQVIQDIEKHLSSTCICNHLDPKDFCGQIAPKELLRSYSDKLTAAITDNLHTISNALYANGLMSLNIKCRILSTTGHSDYEKASYLVTTLLRQLEASLNPQRDLINICHILINQKHRALKDIAASILDQLGQPYHAVISSDLPDDVQEYIKSLKDKYLSQPIIASDWPPRVGQDFFGRLALVRENEFASQAEHERYSWCMLRGHIDEIHYISGYNKVTIETMLNSDLLSLRLAVDGPPGIGKTTLCRKLLNMWSKGSHELQHYDIVLYCPFRHKQVAEATELADLLTCTYKSPKVSDVADWITEREGKGLLIIFDGWDELSTQLREASLATSIICKNQLVYSSVVVTSRTYATASLLQLECLNQNVHVIGFVADEIDQVIKGTLSQELAEKLIEDLELRNDVLSLCYVPLVCSMVILVYQKSGGYLPTTISDLYENFVLQTIRRHVKKAYNDLEPQSIDSLGNLPSNLNASLQQMCEFAYFSLKKETNKMTFTLSQIQSLDIAAKENYLGMITSITDFDEEWYQFIHLSIQEFLAAWWIAKNEKTEEIFKNCFEDDHFRLCLRFVAGLTKLEHQSYQQYFNSTVFDLQCRKRPLFEIESAHPWITPDMHHVSLEKFQYKFMVEFCTLLYLLYESQNTELCHILAQSIKNYSMCLGNISLSSGLQPPFDTLCLTYFINNSNTYWNYLHIYPYETASRWNIINEGIEKSTAQSKTVVINNFLKLVQWPRYFNIQEFYCSFFCFVDVQEFLVFLNFFSELPQLKKLHLNQVSHQRNESSQAAIIEPSSHQQIFVELEESIVSSHLQELYFNMKETVQLKNVSFITDITAALLKGVTSSKTIKSLKIIVDYHSYYHCPPALPNGIIERLLQHNRTLQELSLYLPNELISSALNIKEINAPLTTLEIDETFAIIEKAEQCKMLALLPHITGLKHLKLMLYNMCPPYPLLLSNPNLQYLSLQLQTFDSVIKLFENLTNNTTLLGLKVRIRLQRCFNSGGTICIHNLVRTHIGKNLENLLTNNHILQHLEIIGLDIPYVSEGSIWPNAHIIPNFFLHFLNKGLVQNKSLKHLTVPIEIPNLKGLKLLTIFLDTLSQKKILTELQLYIHINKSDRDATISFFSENGLPHFTNFLRSVRALKILRVEFDCSYYHYSSEREIPCLSTIKKCVYDFMDGIVFHPSLEYVHLGVSVSSCVTNIFEKELKRIMKTYSEQEQKPPPHIDLSDRLNLKEE
ncbi:PREDICTED: uncharacterized protein LOC109583851 [Amphimedon queenslandica]|uniref:NACHT domain-containing protein n=1 Tax=Amphimedon queenslandica TaxID=400682 RepID=A0AAN0JD15_AMPQE|nr:PREDICTED: uncharacterized protein LOC109583851 [Amphimedon queenslandica]XP_019854905.1 PREDICTED: uncharacterized protein LOC109583851 [Amphimedon queenslandica]|eukprot:XP_019854904.1 PREDICTED: uncharacterized protein LOC109583851 [Amphimedon queenslandica]